MEFEREWRLGRTKKGKGLVRNVARALVLEAFANGGLGGWVAEGLGGWVAGRLGGLGGAKITFLSIFGFRGPSAFRK